MSAKSPMPSSKSRLVPNISARRLEFWALPQAGIREGSGRPELFRGRNRFRSRLEASIDAPASAEFYAFSRPALAQLVFLRNAYLQHGRLP